MPWKTGESGNPRGRPPKGRDLATLLAEAGAKRNAAGVELRQAAAQRLWTLIDQGYVEIAGKQVPLNPQEWLRAVAFVFGHIDGPARGPLASDGDGGASLLAQVLAELDGSDQADRATVAAGLGALVLTTLASGNREALTIVGLLQQGLQADQPDVAQLVGARRYLLGLPEPVHTAAHAFFQLPAVVATLQKGAAHE